MKQVTSFKENIDNLNKQKLKKFEELLLESQHRRRRTIKKIAKGDTLKEASLLEQEWEKSIAIEMETNESLIKKYDKTIKEQTEILNGSKK